jgi:hypothetical protein
MKALKILGYALLGIVGLVVLFYLVLLAINWKDQPPSAAAVRFNEIIAARPQVPPAENGIVYTLGFNVPAGQDPIDMGARRLAWIESFHNRTDPGADPLVHTIDMKSAGSPALEAIRANCGDGDRKPCVDVFDQAAGAWQPTEMETLALKRYHELLALHAWRDAIPLHIRAPLPAYAGVIDAQRVYMASVLQLAAQGKGEAVRDALNADLVYWRGAQRNAQNLIAKMIATAALRNHFFFGNLVLRRLPPGEYAAAIPPEWQREFSAAERSMHLVMAGEWQFSSSLWSYVLDTESMEFMMEDGVEEPSGTNIWLDYIGKPMFKLQDTVNVVAERYLDYADRFAVPMTEYRNVKAAIEAQVRDHPHSITVYNPLGDYYLRAVESVTYVSYAFRSANPEGIRRAALLVAQLRAGGLSADAIADAVAESELRDPYTGQPFEWDGKRASVIFTAPEEGVRSRHEFFY